LYAGLRWRFETLQQAAAFPDHGIWQLGNAVQNASELHCRYSFDAVFSSGMPFSDHVIAMAVQSLLGLPWVAEFRDPWAEYVHARQWRREWGRRWTLLTEAAVVRRAAFIVSVNKRMSGRFAERYAAVPARKFVTVENGYDPCDFPAPAAATRSGMFEVVYAGSLYDSRKPDAILSAWRRFIAAHAGAERRARLVFAGRLGAHLDEVLRAGGDGSVTYLGVLPHSQALQAMASASVNLVILPELPGGALDVTAKVYECLGSGRPVLAIVPRHGAAADLLRGMEAVWLCDPREAGEIARALAVLYRSFLAGRLCERIDRSKAQHLTREFQAGVLASVLDRAVQNWNGRRREGPW